jgi:tRNA (Thr-GGU) A37 N-methylase
MAALVVGIIGTLAITKARNYRQISRINCKKPGKTNETIGNTEDIHEHCKRKIAAERIGRINIEKQLRAGVIEKISDPSIGYPLLVIGKVHSPFKARRGTPRQGLLVPNSISHINLSKEIPKETLEGLDGYSHMFVQFIFHENTNITKTLIGQSESLNQRSSISKSSTFTKRVGSFAAKVLPPLLQGGSIGVFATRAPHRPNALGLSLVKIVSVDVDNRKVVISGGDLVDGTPIVDLKPWGPFDCPTCIHNTVDHDGIVNCGKNGDRCDSFKAKIPDWVEYGLKHPYKLPVEWSENVKEELVRLVNNGELEFYKKGNSANLCMAIEQMLGLDLRSVHRGRGGGPQELNIEKPKEVILSTDMVGDISRKTGALAQDYEVEFDCLHINFTVRNGGHEKYTEPFILIENIQK